MVFAERGIQDIRSGRRSRAASPNGQVSDESNATDDSEFSMKVGEEYQAEIPDMISAGPCPLYASEKALLVWAPSATVDDERLDSYINEAKEKYGYNVEQALGMLYWHKYDLEKATADLLNFTPFPDDWTVEDKVLFEQGFAFHGKSFTKIRQMLPDKPLSTLVKYYYSWKKARTRTSLMDRQVRKLSSQKEDGSGSEAGSDNESDGDAENRENKSESSGKAACANCNTVALVFNTPKGNLCHSCCQYLKRTGTLRSSSGNVRSSRHNSARSKRKPPRGMHLDYDDLVAIVTGPSGEGDAILRALDAEIISLKRQVQNNKQVISQHKHKISGGIDSLRPPEGGNRIITRWSNDELLLAVQAIRKYGRDFKAVAELVGNKTEANVKNFFVTYRRRFNLDGVLQEYDAEHGLTSDINEERPMDVDTAVVATPTGNNGHPSSPGLPPPPPQVAPPLLHPPPSPLNVAPVSSHQRLCPPSLQQASLARGSSGRPLLQQPPPLICPGTAFSNGTVKPPTTTHGEAV